MYEADYDGYNDSSSDFDSFSLATVDPNPSIDQTYGGDGGASSLAESINAIGQWGATIGSLITNRPLQVVPTRTGVQAIGVQGSAIASPGLSGQNLTLILIVAAVVVAVVLVNK